MLKKLKAFFIKGKCQHQWEDEDKWKIATHDEGDTSRLPTKIEMVYIQRCPRCNFRREQRFRIG